MPNKVAFMTETTTNLMPLKDQTMARYKGELVADFKEMPQGLLRQRRNLIGASLALVVLDYGDVTFEKMSILGNEIKVNNGGSVQTVAFFACLYFLLRFFQYLHASNGTGITYYYNTHLYHSVSGLPHYNKNTGTSLSRIRGSFCRIKTDSIDPATGEFQEELTLPLFLSIKLHLNALLYVTVKTPQATDYMLPYALSVTAITAHLIDFLCAFS